MMSQWIMRWGAAWLLGTIFGAGLWLLCPPLVSHGDGIKVAERRRTIKPDRVVSATGAEGLALLGWAPDASTEGSYRVLVREDGEDFLVIGSVDLDGDGQAAHYAASRSFNATYLMRHPDVE